MRHTKWLVVGGIILVMIGLLSAGLEKIREAARRMEAQNYLKQIILAIDTHHDAHRRYPQAVYRDEEGNPLHGWRLIAYGFMESSPFYGEYHWDEPWDSPHNRSFLGEESEYRWIFSVPYNTAAEPGMTHYHAFVGPGTAFEKDGLTRDDFPDGLANTIFVVEGREAVPWTSPHNLAYDPNGPLPPLGVEIIRKGMFFGESRYTHDFFLAAFGDGSVRPIFHTMPEERLRAMITRNGGEEIETDW